MLQCQRDGTQQPQDLLQSWMNGDPTVSVLVQDARGVFRGRCDRTAQNSSDFLVGDLEDASFCVFLVDVY